MIEIRDILFRYDVQPVLQGIHCRIDAGELTAVVGPNGSGKSTLIRCINGILKPQGGSVFVDGKDVKEFTPVALARKIAYVPQSIRRQPMTVFDTVLTGRKPFITWKPAGHDLEVTAQILERLRIAHLSMKRINELSGGQQQTVMIARALAQEPQILLLDEPTANLDIRHQLEVLELLRSLARRGICVVIVIHDINQAVRYADRILMLRDGRIFAHGGKEIITKENIEELYHIAVAVIRQDDGLYIVPEGIAGNGYKAYNHEKRKA